MQTFSLGDNFLEWQGLFYGKIRNISSVCRLLNLQGSYLDTKSFTVFETIFEFDIVPEAIYERSWTALMLFSKVCSML